MVRRGLLIFVSSIAGGMIGAFAASLISFWLFPSLQSDALMFLRDVFSFGGVASTAFVWLFYVPALVALLFVSRVFMGDKLKGSPYVFYFAVSFLLIFISQIHPFASYSNGLIEYLLNTILAGIVLMGVSTVSRSYSKRGA